MTLLGHLVKGKPVYEPGVHVKALKGKHVLSPFGTAEIYGPFDSIGEAQEWWEAKRKQTTD